MTSSPPTLMWFRRDLRLADNPALAAAFAEGGPVIPVYIRETGTQSGRASGGASKWWLDKSLKSLAADIKSRGGSLVLRSGDTASCLDALIEETGAKTVFWNRRYDAEGRHIDMEIKSGLKEKGLTAKSFNGSLLTEPWQIKTNSDGHYKVFTPYWKRVRAEYTPPDKTHPPQAFAAKELASEPIGNWKLHPEAPDWSTGFDKIWSPGEAGAKQRLETFLSQGLHGYGEDRNRPDIETGTSGLSPHLAHGEISPVTIWRTVRKAMDGGQKDLSEDSAWTFLSEIVWREFSHVLLYHYPDLATANYNRDFEHMPWRDAPEDYRRWCRGETGYPIVDAGMRQLWQTGWMHNRVRMIVASFLTKHLLLPWQLGEAWFWDTLVDADPAANAASWQWTAGSGADAAPYFRVFNPITQGQKFDASGEYVRKWCPELHELPLKVLHEPWSATPISLAAAGVKLGETYPNPMIDHKIGRQRALDAYDELKSARTS